MKVLILSVLVLWIVLIRVDCFGQASGAEAPSPDEVGSTNAQTKLALDRAERAGVLSPPELAVLRSQLERALADLGVVAGAGRERVSEHLEVVARRSIELAGDLSEPSQKGEAESFLLQARYAQAEQARRLEQADTASIRVGQLRSGAWRIKQHGVAHAETLGDFWLLQADLFDINRSGLDLDRRQLGAIRHIEAFLRNREAAGRGKKTAVDEPAMLQQVQLALLQLYDQRGRSTQVSDLVQRMKQSPHTDHDLRAEMDRRFGYVGWIGKPFDVNFTTAEGEVWSAANHLGKVIVLSFWTDGSLAAGAGPALRRRLAAELRLDRPGLVHVPVWIGDGVGAGRVLGRRIYREQDGRDVSRRFGIRSIPRFILVDREGRVAAVGGATIRDTLDELVAATNGVGRAVDAEHLPEKATGKSPDSVSE